MKPYELLHGYMKKKFRMTEQRRCPLPSIALHLACVDGFDNWSVFDLKATKTVDERLSEKMSRKRRAEDWNNSINGTHISLNSNLNLLIKSLSRFFADQEEAKQSNNRDSKWWRIFFSIYFFMSADGSGPIKTEWEGFFCFSLISFYVAFVGFVYIWASPPWYSQSSLPIANWFHFSRNFDQCCCRFA